MNKPLMKDYCKPFDLDQSLVTFNSKQYAKDAKVYIEELEQDNKRMYDALKCLSNIYNQLPESRKKQNGFLFGYNDANISVDDVTKANEIINSINYLK